MSALRADQAFDRAQGWRAADPPGPGEDLVTTSFADLAADFDELGHILRSSCSRLMRSLDELAAADGCAPWGVRRTVEIDLRRLHRRLTGALDASVNLKHSAHVEPWSLARLARLTAERRSLAGLVRTQQGMVGALVTATDWQSPSFRHSVFPAAGRLVGRVTEHHDDYKRDRHADAADLEAAFLREYVDDPNGIRPSAFATACGMAAFTTVLHVVLEAARTERPVLIGRSTYHECRQMVLRTFGPRAIDVDESDLDGVLRAVGRYRPAAVFVDSLCNAKGLVVPDLEGLIRALVERHAAAAAGEPATRDEDLILVVDNTGRSCTFQPFALLPLPHGRRGLRLVVLESLTKYAQLGLDRTPAGIVVTADQELARGLSVHREHLGTNIPDVAALALPQPRRRVLERRLQRLERNAILLAEQLRASAAASGCTVVTGACHPALHGHPSQAVARGVPFRGGYLAVDFVPDHDRLPMHRRFVELLLDQATALRVPLLAGASFGLDTTRIYLTAATSDLGRPFVRLAAGTEHRLEMERLKLVLGRAVRRLARDQGRLGAGTVVQAAP